MRDIKFSFMWQHQETGRWMELFYTLDEVIGGDPYDDMSDNVFLKSYHHKHTREYTGLDNIYADDIVKITGEGYYSNDAFSVDEPEWEFIGKVEFSSFAWFIVQKDSTWFPFSDLLEHDSIDIEVIGNIYESKELLK